MTQDEPERDTGRNVRVESRYDELREIGKHGHYETMFQVVGEEVERAISVSEKRAEEAERKLAAKDRYDPDDHRHHYDMAYAGHGRGLVIDQVDGKFTERTMTPGELMAREPAMKIAQQIHKLACYAAFAYIKCWEIFAPILSDVTADRDRFKSERDSSQASLLRVEEVIRSEIFNVQNNAPGSYTADDIVRQLSHLLEVNTALSPHTEKSG